MKKICFPILLLSLFISLSINLKIIIERSLEKFIYNFHINFYFLFKVGIGCILLYFLFSFLFRLFDKISLKNTKIIISKKYKILIYLLFFIPTIIYLLSHYPGVFLNDTLFMLYHPMVCLYLYCFFLLMFFLVLLQLFLYYQLFNRLFHV